MTLAESIREAGRRLSDQWVGACDRLLAVHGAHPDTHVLVTRAVPGGQDAWVRLASEEPSPPAPGQMVLQMRTEGTSITIRLVETPT